MESFLLLSGDPALRERLSHYFGAQGFSLHTAPDCRGAVRILEQHAIDVLLFDVPTIDLPLEDLLGAVRDNNATAVVIAMYEEPGIDEAIRAIREGASDFIRKPVNLAELEIRVSRGIELKRLSCEGQVLRGERNLIHRTASFVGRSAAIGKTLALVDKVAKSSSSVLLLGETGTGKELIAGAIHYGSPRAGKAFVRVNCATLPDSLLESELFGHEKGAFTGAEKLRIGRFELGNGGSLFLDEIADVSTATQAKLLRVLQEKEFERLGSNRTIRVDVRIIAATNKDLAAAIEEGRFREDLYYRLNVVTITIPPLRERDGDVELLAKFFLRRHLAIPRQDDHEDRPRRHAPPEGVPVAGEHQGAREYDRARRPDGRDRLPHPRRPEPAVQARIRGGRACRAHPDRRPAMARAGKGPHPAGAVDERVGPERGGAPPGPDDAGHELQGQAVRHLAPGLEEPRLGGRALQRFLPAQVAASRRLETFSFLKT